MKEKYVRDRPLPDDVLRQLQEETHEDRHALARTWAKVGLLLQREPSDEAVARMGGEVWQKIERGIREAPRPARPPKRRVAVRWPAVASTIGALVVALVFYLAWPTTVTAPAGERISLALPDGSTVELNSGASITYAPRSFGWFSRTTTLNGEGFFEVALHRSVFVARTFNAEVRVLGTSFNVRAWPEDRVGETVVALRSGKLQLASRAASSRPVVLSPGQISRVLLTEKQPSAPEEADLSQATAWRTGRFVFVDQPLSTILEEMERRFDVRIEVEFEHILDDRLTLSYDNPSGPEAILNDISSSYSRYGVREIRGGYLLFVP